MHTDPKGKEIKCPNCENMMTLTEKGLQGLIKNYALISLVESKLVMKNSPKQEKEQVKEVGSKSKEKKKKKDNDGDNSENVVKSDSVDSDPDGDGS
tara:strand:- start:321 stop:608 length:288 start_codon:yes stop_codon:yes gene_type:complete